MSLTLVVALRLPCFAALFCLRVLRVFEGCGHLVYQAHLDPSQSCVFLLVARKLSSALRLPQDTLASVLAFPGHSLYFQMCSDHHEGSWTFGQLTTSSTFSRKFSWCFQCMPLAVKDVFFSVRDCLSIAVLFLSPSASWLHILVHFLSNLNADLCFYAGKISPCQFQLSFPPALAL